MGWSEHVVSWGSWAWLAVLLWIPCQVNSYSSVVLDDTQRICGKNKFICTSGECVNLSQLCDGISHCQDGSDESAENCTSLIRDVRSTTGGSCFVPELPANGNYSFVTCDTPPCQPMTGFEVSKGAVLSYTCYPDFQLLGPGYIVCDGGWSPPPPLCEQVVCPPLNDPTRILECELNNEKVPCNETVFPGTKASIKCMDLYETIHGPSSFTTTCKRTGDWSNEILSCKPRCGVVNLKGTPLIENGIVFESGEIPWHATLYKSNPWTYICGGTIISTRMIVTSAVCLYDHTNQATRNLTSIGVKVGNTESQWDKNTKYGQEVAIDRLLIHPMFREQERFYKYDIGLITLKKEITINEAVRPICVDYENKYSNYFVPGMVGVVQGAESTSRDKALTMGRFPYLSLQQCENGVPQAFLPYLTSDKFCVAGNNGSKICKGDGGSGYATQFRDGRWYFTGIVSVGPNTCNVTALTRVSEYYKFIMDNDPENEGSILAAAAPPPPNIGCRSDEFQCRTHSCLRKSLVCDGLRDCDDGSDETSEECSRNSCSPGYFRCRYGACIKINLVCNGRQDCVDGSDEHIQHCSSVTPNAMTTMRPAASTPINPTCVVSESQCELPEQPINGQYTIQGCVASHFDPKPKSRVSVGVFLNFTCNPGFALVGSPLLFCSQGWTSLPPVCEEVLCSPLVNPSRDIVCVYRGDDMDCDSPMQPGTRASLKCKGNYETVPGLISYDMICNSSGLWNREIHSCVPKCGEPNPKAVTYVGFGTVANAAEFPWHIGLYRPAKDGSYELFCGGSIVSLRVVVTAAHCFWNLAINKRANTTGYRAIAGKFYRDWNKANPNIQHLEIKEVILHKYFRGTTNNYMSDIAAVILQHNIIISAAIRPICVDYDKNFHNYFVPNTVGKVVGWGITETMKYSEVLKSASLPYISLINCEEKTPEGFHPFIVRDDSFCAGNDNGTSVCPGDSGGGYAVQFKDKRWYLVGIVSLGVTPEGDEECSLFNYAGFTKVFNYIDFIREHVYKYV